MLDIALDSTAAGPPASRLYWVAASVPQPIKWHNITTMTRLTDAQLAHYRLHGWVAPIDVLSSVEAGDLLAALEDAEARFPEHLHAEQRNNAHLILPWLADLAAHERIVDAVETIVGADVALWSTVLFIKEPNSTSFVSWHQDAFYMGLEPDNFVTAWVALSLSNRDTGCVSVVPGTHRSRATHEDRFGQDNILTRGQTVTDVDESRTVDLVLKPGQMSLHHPWLIHGSQPNRSDTRRVGVAMQSYLGADVRPTRGEHYVLPIRGAQPDSAFRRAGRPTTICAPHDVEARSLANAALSSVLYDGAEQTRRL